MVTPVFPIFWQLCTLNQNWKYLLKSLQNSLSGAQTQNNAFSRIWMKSESMDIQWKGGNRCGSWRLDSCQARSHIQLCSQPGEMPAPTATNSYLLHNSPPNSKNCWEQVLSRWSIDGFHTSILGDSKVQTIRLWNKWWPAWSVFFQNRLSIWHMVNGTDEAILRNYKRVKETFFNVALQSWDQLRHIEGEGSELLQNRILL